MEISNKPLVWLQDKVKSPPFSQTARLEAGYLLRKLQRGEILTMPSVGQPCHELRINDTNSTWCIIYRIDTDVIIILHIFNKKTSQTPKQIIDLCQQRIKLYDSI